MQAKIPGLAIAVGLALFLGGGGEIAHSPDRVDKIRLWMCHAFAVWRGFSRLTIAGHRMFGGRNLKGEPVFNVLLPLCSVSFLLNGDVEF